MESRTDRARIRRRAPSPSFAEDALLPPFLELAARLCGARRAHWIPVGEEGPAGSCGPRPGLDLGLLAGLAAGEEREIPSAGRRPRLAALGIERVRLRASSRCGPGGPAGVLWLTDPGPRRPDALGGLADHAARLAASDGKARRAARDAARGRSAAGLLHDLRGELSLASLELVRLGAGEDGRSLAASLERTRALCRAGLAGRDGGRGGVQGAGPVDLAALVRTEIGRLAGSSPRTRARLERDGVRVAAVGDARPTLVVAATPLRRVVRNLLTNAVEASVPGGRVEVQLERTEGGHVVLTVVDRGRGMDPTDVERAFRDGGTIGGTGYGTTSLFECLRELHAGLELKSRRGRGTTVRVVLPRGRAGDGEGSTRRPSAPPCTARG